jgi:hypothetical protein
LTKGELHHGGGSTSNEDVDKHEKTDKGDAYATKDPIDV